MNGATMSPARQMKSRKTAPRAPTTTLLVVGLQRDLIPGAIIVLPSRVVGDGVLGLARRVGSRSLCRNGPRGGQRRFRVELTVRNGPFSTPFLPSFLVACSPWNIRQNEGPRGLKPEGRSGEDDYRDQPRGGPRG